MIIYFLLLLFCNYKYALTAKLLEFSKFMILQFQFVQF